MPSRRGSKKSVKRSNRRASRKGSKSGKRKASRKGSKGSKKSKSKGSKKSKSKGGSKRRRSRRRQSGGAKRRRKSKGSKKSKSKGSKKSKKSKKSKRKGSKGSKKSKRSKRRRSKQKGGSASKDRYFKLVVDGSRPTGRFSGSKPKQAAAKALNALLKKRKESGKSVKGKFHYSMVECTRGSKCKEYNYVGERVKLPDPVTVTIGQKEITYRHSNKVFKEKGN